MSRIFYLIKQGIENIFKNKLMFIASVLIITTTMITLGIFTIIGENVKSMVDKMQSSQGIIAYLETELDEAGINSVKNRLKGINGITEITYESKEEALQNAREEYFDETNIDLTTGWEENNIFSASFTLSIDKLQDAELIAKKVEKISGIRKVTFDNDVFNAITKISDLVRIVVMGVFILLVGVSYLVISNTIKLVLHSRRKEINIMKYIGATDAFVKTPFIIEGVIVGIVGAIIAWLITIQMYQALISNFADNSIFEFVLLNFEILKMNLIIGVLVSSIACAMSIKRYLKV